jgi:hypothetical protein
MGRGTQTYRRAGARNGRERYAWRVVRRFQVRRALEALDALYRRCC